MTGSVVVSWTYGLIESIFYCDSFLINGPHYFYHPPAWRSTHNC